MNIMIYNQDEYTSIALNILWFCRRFSIFDSLFHCTTCAHPLFSLSFATVHLPLFCLLFFLTSCRTISSCIINLQQLLFFFSFNVPVSFSSVAVAFFFSCPFDLLSCTQLLSLMIEIYRSKNLLCRHDFSFALSFIPSLFFLC